MDIARHEAANLIPADASVRASEQVLPLLSDRTRLYVLETVDDPDSAAVAATPKVEWIVFDPAAAPDWRPLDILSFDLDVRRTGFERLKLDAGDGDLRVYRLLNVIES